MQLQLESHLGFWLRFISNHVSVNFAKRLEQQQVTVTEWVALCTLWQQPQTSFSALIEALGMTKSAASKVMTRLESKGYAERHFVEGNHRGQWLVLTEAGRQLVPQLAAIADANEAQFFSHLPATERQQLFDSLQALVQYHQLKNLPID